MEERKGNVDMASSDVPINIANSSSNIGGSSRNKE